MLHIRNVRNAPTAPSFFNFVHARHAKAYKKYVGERAETSAPNNTKVYHVQLNAHAKRPVGWSHEPKRHAEYLYSTVFAISKLRRKVYRAQTAWHRKRGSRPCN